MLKKTSLYFTKIIIYIKTNGKIFLSFVALFVPILQTIILFNQTTILKNQTKIQETEVQPFFRMFESIDNENKYINIYNLGNQCYITNITHVTFLKTTFEVSHHYETLLTPIIFYNGSQRIFDNSLVYQVVGYKNALFTNNLLQNPIKVASYFQRETYIKINFSDKLGVSRTLYFNSRGIPIDTNNGVAIFELHRKLIKVYEQFYKNPYFHIDVVTPDFIKDLVKNDTLLKEIKKLKNDYPSLNLFNN